MISDAGSWLASTFDRFARPGSQQVSGFPTSAGWELKGYSSVTALITGMKRILFHSFVCVCAWRGWCMRHMHAHMWEVRGQLSEVSSLLSPWGSRELNSGHRAWQPAPFLAEPSSHQPWWKSAKREGSEVGSCLDSVRTFTRSELRFSHLSGLAKLSLECSVSVVCTTTESGSKCHYLVICRWLSKGKKNLFSAQLWCN